jgi:hypothetical protein
MVGQPDLARIAIVHRVIESFGIAEYTDFSQLFCVKRLADWRTVCGDILA